MNDGWAKPFGDFNHRWTHALFGAMPPIRDLLNGRWLVYRHERVIGNFPTEKAAMAPEFLRLLKKASRPDVDEHLVHFATAAARQLRHREK